MRFVLSFVLLCLCSVAPLVHADNASTAGHSASAVENWMEDSQTATHQAAGTQPQSIILMLCLYLGIVALTGWTIRFVFVDIED